MSETIMSETIGARRLLEPGANKLKLGLFGLNCKNGLNLTMAETNYVPTWEHTLAISQRADDMGFEILVPIARWRGFEGASDPFGESFETMIWAAGIASKTRNVVPVGTLHVPLMHPVFAAKQCATLDHLSGGRFAFNAVMGWVSGDFEMFGQELREHDERYRYGAEWMDVVRRIWTEPEPFDFDGEYFQLRNVRGKPQPLQDPYPLILNAGNSSAGMNFAAKEADFNFAIVETLESGREYVDKAKAKAAEYGRDLHLLGNASVICRDSEDEAMTVVEEMRSKGDREATRNSLKEFGINSDSLSEEYFEFEDNWMISMGSRQLYGTPEMVAESLAELSAIGLDGVMLASLDYYDELGIFNERVMPLLVEMGLRQEVGAISH
ncbi:MAG: LLM class flavin-dependent oxidoreductase [Actinobacteria bacterium]|nr:LLM class flavin-dependent oxidoreductase [Actinomycetota bacterium]